MALVKIELTLPEKDARKLILILQNAVKKAGKSKAKTTSQKWKEKRDKDRNLIRQIASELNVLEKTKQREVMTLRSALVYFLRKHYTGPLIAEAFRWDNSTVISCVKRYEDLKHYPDWQEASATVTQHLTRYSLADSR